MTWTPKIEVRTIETRKIERDGRLVCMVSASATHEDWNMLRLSPRMLEMLRQIVDDPNSDWYDDANALLREVTK